MEQQMQKHIILGTSLTLLAALITGCEINEDVNPNPNFVPQTTQVTITPSLGKILNAKVVLKNAKTGAMLGEGNTGNTGNTGTSGGTTTPADDPSWINLTIQSKKDEIVMLSDDGKNYQEAPIKAGEAFVFKFEIYNYGWLRLKYFNGYRVYKLTHGKDYSILWNRRTKNWTVVEIPE